MNETGLIRHPTVMGSLLFSMGVICSSITLGMAVYKSRQTPRYVSVKGLAEREVEADMAVWPIKFTITDNDLESMQKQIEKKRSIITEFLTKQGFSKEEIFYGTPTIRDRETRSYGDHRKFRYVAEMDIKVRSSKVLTVENTLQKAEELVAKGIVLEDYWEARPQFIFTKLNAIKPAMIQAATISARKAAEQFAEDSGSKVGNIRNATQGSFSIEDMRHIPTKKYVRVVTTIQYFLVDN